MKMQVALCMGAGLLAGNAAADLEVTAVLYSLHDSYARIQTYEGDVSWQELHSAFT